MTFIERLLKVIKLRFTVPETKNEKEIVDIEGINSCLVTEIQ